MLSVSSAPLALTPSGRLSYARIAEIRDGVSVDKFEVPNLIELQLESFQWFIEKGLRDLFDEISPIKDFTGKVMELQFLDYEFGTPKYSEEECRTKDLTFSRPLYVNVELLIKETGEIQRQRVYMGDYPWMTDMGTFVINGAERVVVSQLVRSPGVYYSELEDPGSGRALFSAKVIPNRGAWLEFETNNKDQLWVKVDRKRKIAATTLLRAVGYEANDEIAGLFGAVDLDPEHPFIANTLDKDLTKSQSEALIEVYKKLRPGDPPTGDNARQLVESLFFNFRRYDLGRVGRYKFNKKLDPIAARLGIELPREQRTITREDIASIVGHLIESNRGLHPKDDIDHLGNRRIRANGELIQNAFRIGLLRMERVVRERMTIQEIDKATPNALINIRPVVAAMKEFFGGSQLSQFMDQTNPLAELTSKRRLSALGPGGLSRERAGFDVRDVHHSHYGRICPIETPEGPNIGLIGSLATYGRINAYGFIETPYRKVKRTVAHDDPNLLEYEAGADLAGKDGKVIVAKGSPAHRGRPQGARPPEGARVPHPPDRDRRHRLPPRRRGGGACRRPGQCPAGRGRPLHRRARPVPLPGYVPGGSPRPDRVHGRQPQAGRLGRDGADPVPRARRRQPRPDGLQHAAPGRPAARARGADRRHRHGGARRARLRPGRDRPPRRRRDQRDRRARPGRGRLGRAGRVPAAQVRAQQPGHLHQPAPDRHGRPARSTRATRSRTRRPRTAASWHSAGTSWWRS